MTRVREANLYETRRYREAIRDRNPKLLQEVLGLRICFDETTKTLTPEEAAWVNAELNKQRELQDAEPDGDWG
jgi:hypothetical protein